MVSDVDRASESGGSARCIGRRRPHDGVARRGRGTSRLGSDGGPVGDRPAGRHDELPLRHTAVLRVHRRRDLRRAGGRRGVRPLDGTRCGRQRKGHGSFLNGVRCQVAARPLDPRSGRCVPRASGTGRSGGSGRPQAAEVIPAVRDIRRFGSAALDLELDGRRPLRRLLRMGAETAGTSAAGALVAAEAGARVESVGRHLVVVAARRTCSGRCAICSSWGRGFDAPPGPEPAEW